MGKLGDKLAKKLADSKMVEKHVLKQAAEEYDKIMEREREVLAKIAPEFRETVFGDMKRHGTIAPESIGEFCIKYGKLDVNIRDQIYEVAKKSGMTPTQIFEEALKRKKEGEARKGEQK